ncbi:MAG TPA: ATP-dependent DNA ligase [Candidatus Avipropionibacterium avicola]|uniref:DNA ligase n=1 Tax=Candidatus Avipropionibacterium avicola TaxID=2840701 RepID=A0A9D1KN32_9ACTN|nr:ATP-dependent DNA ligase [Candidatus Avipropionibacterium avicola]
MLLAEVAQVSVRVGATRSRLAKREALAELIRRCEPEDVAVVVTYLAGELRQRRTGIGRASLADLPEPASTATLEVGEVDAELERVAALAGPGSADLRRAATVALFARATAAEQRLLRGLLSGEVRQGALDAAIVEAVALASDVPVAAMRRAVMLRGSTAAVAEIALREGATGVAAVTAVVGQPVGPMLASSAPDVAAALARIDGPACVDAKLDGIRIQAHRWVDDHGEVRVRLFTRSLDDITDRLGDIADLVRGLEGELILDGEVLATDARGTPQPFQDTASRAARHSVEGNSGEETAEPSLHVAFFDLLWVDGHSVVDEPLRARLTRLDEVVPAQNRIRRLVGDDPEQAQQFFDETVAAGLEGVVVKSMEAGYEAGRRGAGWVKVKPRHTLDLVVLAVEQGSGRRRGWLSNIHLGARDPQTGGFVMVGKTFKGMTDEMLAWQTERFGELAADRSAVERGDWVVGLRPVQVVEIAVDGIQRSRRYPGGVALRFARVLRYRDDKSADEADTIDSVRTLGDPPS